MTMGAPNKPGAIFELTAPGEAPYSLIAGGGWYAWRWANSKDVMAFRGGAPEVFFPHGVQLGNVNATKRITVRATVTRDAGGNVLPPVGAGAPGEIVFNSEPRDGEPVGWQWTQGPNGSYWRVF